MRMPHRGEDESITHNSKSRLEKLIAKAMGGGYRLHLKMDSARCKTYLSDASLFAAIRRHETKRDGQWPAL